MSEHEFAGILSYLVSPVEQDGRVKEEILRRLVKHLTNSGVHGLTPLGSTGEYRLSRRGSWRQHRKDSYDRKPGAGQPFDFGNGFIRQRIRVAYNRAVRVSDNSIAGKFKTSPNHTQYECSHIDVFFARGKD